MFKLLFAVLILLLSLNVFPESYLYNNINTMQYSNMFNEFRNSDFRIYYCDSTNLISFYSDEGISLSCFSINIELLDSIENIILKYKDWNIKASNKNVELHKKISHIKTAESCWRYGDNWHFSYPVELEFSFYSLSTQIHLLVLTLSDMQSKYNEYLTHNPKIIYLKYNEAIKLMSVLKIEKIKEFNKKIEKQKSIESEFK